MTPYWLLFGLWLAGTILFNSTPKSVNSCKVFTVACAITALMIGLRYKVGGDWEPYLNIYRAIYFLPFSSAMEITDPGYAAANWMAAKIEVGIWLPNLVCGTIFIAGVGRLAWRQPHPWLAMLIAIPYFVIVVAMGYTRQAAAIGIVCLAIADADEGNVIRTVAIISVAALFHKTAVLMLPIVLAPIALKRAVTATFGVIAFVVIFFVLLSNRTDDMIANYAQSTYDSQGAGVRIAMNAVASATFVIFKRRFGFDPYQASIWNVNVILSFASIFALVNLSASSGVDRLALFLIPLQMAVFSRLPGVLSSSSKQVPSVLLGLILYCFSVQFVWLNFADNSVSWMPYRTIVLSTG